MKHTAVEWLIGRFHYEGFIGTYCSEEQIKSKRQMMIKIIEQAKEMEKEQITLSHINGQSEYDTEKFRQYNKDLAEAYYNTTFKNTKQ